TSLPTFPGPVTTATACAVRGRRERNASCSRSDEAPLRPEGAVSTKPGVDLASEPEPPARAAAFSSEERTKADTAAPTGARATVDTSGPIATPTKVEPRDAFELAPGTMLG